MSIYIRPSVPTIDESKVYTVNEYLDRVEKNNKQIIEYTETALNYVDEIKDSKGDKVDVDNLYQIKVDKTDLKDNRHLDEYGDFTGSWHGVTRPELSEPGIAGAVIKNTDDIVVLKSEINSLTFFPRLTGETNDYNRIMRVINATQTGGTVKIPTGSYDLGGNDVDITKSLKIEGDGMHNTIINNGGFSIESSNCEIRNLFVNCPSLDNGFQINQTSVSNILIENCKSIAKDHSFLMESYNGLVQDVKVINCISSNSIHGFISKAISIVFENCKATGHTGFAFGFISDNIPSSTQIANCINNRLENCEVSDCGTGFFSYCRDKWNVTCQPRTNNNSVNGLTISTTTNPFAVGEESVPVDYLSIYRIDFMTINNVKVFNPVQTVWAMSLRNCYRCIVDNCILPYKLEQKTTSQECLIGNVVIENSRPHTKPITLGSTGSSGTVDVSLNNVIEVLVSGNPTDKVTFTGLPKNGSDITVIVRSTGTTTFGGFETSNTHLGGVTIVSSFAFNHAQVTRWIWVTGLNKFMCVNATSDIAL